MALSITDIFKVWFDQPWGSCLTVTIKKNSQNTGVKHWSAQGNTICLTLSLWLFYNSNAPTHEFYQSWIIAGKAASQLIWMGHSLYVNKELEWLLDVNEFNFLPTSWSNNSKIKHLYGNFQIGPTGCIQSNETITINSQFFLGKCKIVTKHTLILTGLIHEIHRKII